MKRTKYIIVAFLSLIIFSCEDCECIDDSTPPVANCDNGLFIMRSEGVSGAPTTFYLDSISKPISTPVVFDNITINDQDETQFGQFTRPSNYDAFDVTANTYFIEFPLQQRLYKYDVATQSRQEFIVAGFYSAPVFNNGTLYAIEVDFSNFGYATNPAVYEIKTVDQNNGSVSTLTSGSFSLQSYFNWESMSSVADGNGMVYFISGSNLIVFNTNTSTAQHIELVPEFDFTNNNQIFYGLEMRNNGNLLAIRNRDNDMGEGIELVEIDVINPTESPTVVFDFMANGIDPNSEYYATTYDACDDTYYLTSRSMENFELTNFYEIDLPTGNFQTESFDVYLMGIESKN